VKKGCRGSDDAASEPEAASCTLSAAKMAFGSGGARRTEPAGVAVPEAGIEVSVATSQGSARAASSKLALALHGGCADEEIAAHW